MCKITKVNDEYYYGPSKFKSAEEVYRRFRKDYNNSVGRSAFLMLGRLGQRKERVHGSGLVFTENKRLKEFPETRIKSYMLGLVNGSYCKTIGIWDVPYELNEQNIHDWLDWIFCKGNKAIRVVGVRQKTGRTSKRNINNQKKKNYGRSKRQSSYGCTGET